MLTEHWYHLGSQNHNYGPDCVLKSMIGNQSEEDDLPNFDGKIDIVDYVQGTLHLILLFTVIFFVLGTLMRNHRLTKMQWVQLLNLAIICLISVIIDYEYFGMVDGGENCLYWNHVFFGVTDILLFNL